MHTHIAVIGSGNMGRAIAQGLLNKKLATQQLHLTNSQTSNTDAVKKAAIIILAVKPQIKDTVLEEIKHVITDQLVISVMAGVRIDAIQQALGKNNAVVRVMPNISAKVGKSLSVWVKSVEVTETQKEQAKQILEAIGEQVELKNEDEIDKATAISGSGPAYFFYLTEILETAAMQLGFPQTIAQQLAKQTLIGSAELLNISGDSSKNLRLAVTSKGGTTETAIEAFKKENLESTIIKGTKAAYTKAKALGAKK